MMIRWRITLEYSVNISLDVADTTSEGRLKFQGPATLVAQIKQHFEFASGAFGHLIEDATQPINAYDADSILRSAYPDVEVLEGAQLVASYDAGLTGDRVT